MARKKTRTMRKCGKSAKKADCDTPKLDCINCRFKPRDQVAKAQSAALMFSKGSGNKVPLTVQENLL